MTRDSGSTEPPCPSEPIRTLCIGTLVGARHSQTCACIGSMADETKKLLREDATPLWIPFPSFRKFLSRPRNHKEHHRETEGGFLPIDGDERSRPSDTAVAAAHPIPP